MLKVIKKHNKEWFKTPLLSFHRNLPQSPLLGSYLLEFKKFMDEDNKKIIQNAIYQLITRHEALRVRFSKNKQGEWCQAIYPPNKKDFIIEQLNLSNLTKREQSRIIKSYEQSMVKAIEDNLISFRAVFIDVKNKQYFLIIFNHHHFDITSQKIFFKELEISCKNELSEDAPSYTKSVKILHKLASRNMKEELEFWKTQLIQTQPLPLEFKDSAKTTNTNHSQIPGLTVTNMSQVLNESSLKLKELFTSANIQVDEILLTAWIQVLHQWLKMPKFVINMVTHGRGTIEGDIGFLENVIGCFVSIYPLCLYLPANIKGKQAILYIKSLLKRVPHQGMSYGILRFCSPKISTFWQGLPLPYLFFHFQITSVNDDASKLWAITKSQVLNSINFPDRLEPIWVWNETQGKFYCSILHGSSFSSEVVKKLLDQYYIKIKELVNHLLLEEKIGHKTSELATTYLAPRNMVEQKLADIWSMLLYKQRIGIHDNFFLLGGGSIQIVRLVAKIKENFNKSVSMVSCFQSPTIAEQARFCAPGLANINIDPLLPVQIYQNSPALFLVHPIEGNSFPYLNLRQYLKGQTIYGLNNPRFTEPENPFKSVEEIAAFYVIEIKKIQPTGPYHLGGWSFGGTVALEMARQLQIQGEVINFLIFIDTLCYTPLTTVQQSRANRLSKNSDNELPEVKKYITSCAQNHWNIQQAYKPRKYSGRVILIKARELNQKVIDYIYKGRIPPHLQDVYAGWFNLIENLEIYSVPGSHGNLLLNSKNTKAVAKVIKEAFNTIDGHPFLDKKLPLDQRLLSFAKYRKDKYLTKALLNASKLSSIR